MNLKYSLFLFFLFISSLLFGQVNCITFDFNNGLAGWEIQPNNTITTNEAFWQFKDYGKADGGTYWDDRDSIYSDSKGGAIMMDGDEFANGPVGNTPFVSEIRSPNLNFQGFQDKVYLKFSQYYRNFNSTTRIEVSGDGGTSWDTIFINQEVQQNVETSPGSFKVLDLTDFVNIGGENLVRFVLEGEYYFWIIDDVEFCDQDPSPQTFPAYVGDSLKLWDYPYLVDSSDWAIVPNELVVQFKPDVTEPERQALRDSLGVIKIDSCVCDRLELWAIGVAGGDTLSPFGNTIDINEKAKGSKGSSKVDGVDFNRYNYNELQSAAPPPNLPLGPNDIPYQIPSTPAGATLIAILDTGIDYDHPDLVNYIFLNDDIIDNNNEDDDENCYPDDPIGWNFVDDNNNPFDDHSHGTHVAGIVVDNFLDVANTNNISCDFRIIPYKTHDFHGVSNLFDVTCATYQAQVDGASVINDSWGFYGDSSIILSNAIDTVSAYDILVVTAAGNDSLDLSGNSQYPACYADNNILTVGSVIIQDDPNGGIDTLLSDFSNFSNSCVDILAPGEDIISTVPNDDTDIKSGTSMSAPAVAAVSAIFYCYGFDEYSAVKDSLLSCSLTIPSLSNDVMDGNLLHFDLACLTTSSTELPEYQPFNISIFPNPTVDKINIQAMEKLENIHLQISDIHGKSIFQKQIKDWDAYNIQEHDISEMPAGIYLLSITNGTQVWSYKLIKY